MRIRVGLIGVVLALVAGAVPAAAQQFTGGVRGAVRDANGVIPGVSVTLTNQATNISREVTTNDVGQYNFPAVPPGTYSLKANVSGYKTFESKDLVVGTQQFITLDVMLEVGAIEESVTVTGQSPLIDTSTASTGGVLDRQALESLPAPGRNAFLIGVTVPTVMPNGDPQFNRQQDQSNASLISIGGGGIRANNYMVDGVPITELRGRAVANPTMEALEDIKVQVHTYDAEMGRTGGGVFNVTARSGTDAYHGGALIQVRPEWGMANNFFNARAGIPIQQGLFYNAYAGSVGGPIVKRKTFFWVASEGYRDKSGWNGQLILPTDRERSGDFSQTFDRNGALVVVYDPLTTRPDGRGGYLRDPFPGNVIAANRINPVARSILSYLDRAQTQRSGADGNYNFTTNATLSNQADSVTVKGEHKVTGNWSLTGAYLYSHTNEPFQVYLQEHPQLDPGWNIVMRRPKVLAINSTHVMSPSTVMTLRGGWMSFPSFGTPGSADFDMASLGFPPSYVNAVAAEKFPRVTVLNMGQVGGSALIGDAGYAYTRDSSYNFNGTVSKLIGRHTFKFGADFRDLRRESASLGQTAGTFNFDPGWTQSVPGAASRTDNGNSFASFLLGLPTANPASVSSVPINTPLEIFVRYYSGYAQDDWRSGSELTVNYGLRYEWETGLREIDDRFLVAFDRAVTSPLAARTGLDLHGGLRYAGQDGFPESQGDPSKKKFSPRLGIAWSLNEATVFRGGYGLFWAPSNYGSIAALGYQQVTNIDQSNNLTPTVTLSDPFPNGLLQPVGNSRGLLTGVGGPITFNSQDRHSEYLQQYSFDLQRQLPGSMAIAVGYVGTRGDDLNYGTININQLAPDIVAQFGSRLNDQVPNPFFGIADAGAFGVNATISRGQLLRPFPQFGNVLQDQTTGARTRYHSVTARFDKRGES